MGKNHDSEGAIRQKETKPMEWIEASGVKRFFRARRKLNSPDMISHITQRAAGVDRLFHENDDYLEFLGRMKKVSETYLLEIISFVFMPNHVHLLVYQTEDNLPDVMRELFSRFARRQNVKYARMGHLFGGPYRQAVCLDDVYALTVSLYIHLNPVRAGLAEDPLGYPWSSCEFFCKGGEQPSFLYPDRVLRYISDDPGKAAKDYKRMLYEGLQLKAEEVLEDQEAIHRFQWRLSKLPVFRRLVQFLMIKDPEEEEERIVIPEYDFAEIMHELAEKRPIELPKDKEARRYLIEQLLSRGYTRREIAKRLGLSRKTVYNIMTD
jgi:putative transposase